MSELIGLTAAELAQRLASGEVTSLQATRSHLGRLGAAEEEIHAFWHVNTDEALAAARNVDARRAAGEDLPELAGVPVAVKDVLVTKGQVTTAGSKMLQDWVPPYDATLVTRLRDRKSTRLNSSHVAISYAVFCLKKKNRTMEKY